MHSERRPGPVRLAWLFLIISFTVLSCSTAPPEADTADAGQELPDDSGYMSRPKILIDTPVASLPYTLKWENVLGARSYELQIADNRNFSSSLQSWTLKDTSFVVEMTGRDEVFVRIRSRYPQGYSRWTEPLRISRTDEGIMLQWER